MCDFEEEFGAFYSEEGRPPKPVRLMVGLLMLKQLDDLSDEKVVEAGLETETPDRSPVIDKAC